MQIYSPSISIYHTHTYIYIRLWGGFGPVVFQWFSGGLSGKLFEVARQHCLFLQGERVSMRKRSAQVLRAEKNPHTCACHATLAAEHERSKSLCVSPTSTRSFGLQDLGPRRLRPRKACGASVAEARCCEKAAGTDAEREVTQFMETAADTTPDHKRMHTVQLWHEAPRNQCPFPCPASPLPARCRSTKNLGRHDRTQGTWCCSKASWRESPLTSSLPKSRGRRGGVGDSWDLNTIP